MSTTEPAVKFHGPVLECQRLLDLMGIDNEIQSEVLFVDRTSCVQNCPSCSEEEAYDTVLALLREAFPSWYVYFSARTDVYFTIDFHFK